MVKIDAFPCRSNGRHLDWDWMPTDYLPNTCFPWVDYFSERCQVCGVVVCRMITEHGNTRSFYQASSYPDGYKYSEDEAPPTPLERFQMRKERGEAEYMKREQRAAARRSSRADTERQSGPRRELVAVS